jgi:hypothetical protein
MIDRSYQYAIFWGDFDSNSGGELAVEGHDEEHDGAEFVNVVTTHNRIARVDGRHVGWVKSWVRGNGGDRYGSSCYPNLAARCRFGVCDDSGLGRRGRGRY